MKSKWNKTEYSNKILITFLATWAGQAILLYGIGVGGPYTWMNKTLFNYNYHYIIVNFIKINKIKYWNLKDPARNDLTLAAVSVQQISKVGGCDVCFVLADLQRDAVCFSYERGVGAPN